jgi:hypothetical protein
MNKAKLVKYLIVSVTGAGATAITKGVINAHIYPTNLRQKVLFFAGRWGSGSLVGTAVSQHTESEIDAVLAIYEEWKAAYKVQTSLKK